MRIELQGDERAVLQVVLESAANIMREEGAKAGQQELVKILRGAKEVLDGLQTQSQHMNLSYAQADLVADIIGSDLDTLIRQEGTQKGADLEGVKTSEVSLQGLRRHFAAKRIDLLVDENLALGALLRQNMEVLDEERSKGEASAKAHLDQLLEVLLDVRRRLSGLELSESEAELVKKAGAQLLQFAEKQQSSASGAAAEDLRLGADLLRRLQTTLRAGFIELVAEQWVALFLVLQGTTAMLAAHKSEDAQTSELVSKTQGVVKDLLSRLLGLEVVKYESELLQEIVRMNLGYIEKQMKSAEGGQEQSLELAAGVLRRVEGKLKF